MILTPSDPDVQTLLTRIEEGHINLQPDFQRGEVWPMQKKKRLIDTIFRNWHVPPIHIVVLKNEGQEILDGQQRLAAIRDYANNLFSFDGFLSPEDPELKELNGLNFSDLPASRRHQFLCFTIRTFRITNYGPDEPAELFFRLNQPTYLTSAEQRNAFYGPTRDQVRYLVELMKKLGIDETTIGFSNTRMSYNDVISRFLVTLEARSLREKTSSGILAARFRSRQPFDEGDFERAMRTLHIFGDCVVHYNEGMRFNKATLYSWLCFLTSVDHNPLLGVMCEFMHWFEAARQSRRSSHRQPSVFPSFDGPPYVAAMLEIFNDRASSRVLDLMSILSRDIVLWLAFYLFSRERGILLPKTSRTNGLRDLIHELEQTPSFTRIDSQIQNFIINTEWGML